MASFTPAPADLLEVVERVTADRFPRLLRSDPQVRIVWLGSWGLTDRGHEVHCKAKVTTAEERARGGPDAVVIVNLSIWTRVTGDTPREAIVAEGLYALVPRWVKATSDDIVTDVYGRPRIKLRPVNVHVSGYKEVVAWYGHKTPLAWAVESAQSKISQAVMSFERGGEEGDKDDGCDLCGEVGCDGRCDDRQGVDDAEPDAGHVPLGDEQLTLSGSMVEPAGADDQVVIETDVEKILEAESDADAEENAPAAEDCCETCLQPWTDCMCPEIPKRAEQAEPPVSTVQKWDVWKWVRREPADRRYIGQVEGTNQAQAQSRAIHQWPDVWPSQIEVARYRQGVSPEPERVEGAIVAESQESDSSKILDVSSLPPPRSKRRTTHYVVLRRRGDQAEPLGEVEADYDGMALQEAKGRWPFVPTRELEIRPYSGKPPKADRKPRKPKAGPVTEPESHATFLVFKGSARKPLYAIRAAALRDAVRMAKARAAAKYTPRVAIDEKGKAKALGLESIYAAPVEVQEVAS